MSTVKVSMPNDITSRFIRGSGWGTSIPSGMRAAFHPKLVPSHRGYDLGFRCALAGRAPR